MKMGCVLGLICSLVLGFSAHADDGGMTSSGGDDHRWGFESAWFLGTQPISYCIEIASGEKISYQQVRSDFESVVSTWKRYYLERAPNLHDVYHKLNFSYQLENCQPSTRLKLYVGVENAAVAHAKTRFEKPYALSYRSDFDFTAGVGHGFVWFAPRSELSDAFPDWSVPNVFHGMLLHEMGHVYGCGHMKHTIMDANLISDLQAAASDDKNWAAYGKMYMTHIDHHMILLYSPNTHIKMKGEIYLNEAEAAARFQRLTGRVPVGQTHAQVETFENRVELTLSDDVRSDLFTLPLNYENRTSFDLGGQVFFSVRGATGLSTGSGGAVFLTSLKTARGERLTAQVEINSDGIGWPIRVRYLDGGLFKEVFESDLWMNEGLPR